jgi:hypothetical protein
VTAKKDDDKGATETVETEETTDADNGDDDDDDDSDDVENANWSRLQDMIRGSVAEELTKWSKQQPKRQRTTSSSSQQRVAKRKKGFLSEGFFSNLTDRD